MRSSGECHRGAQMRWVGRGGEVSKSRGCSKLTRCTQDRILPTQANTCIHTHYVICRYREGKKKTLSPALLYHIPDNSWESNTIAKLLLSSAQPYINQPYCCSHTIVSIVPPLQVSSAIVQHVLHTKPKAACTSSIDLNLEPKWRCWVNVPWSTPLKVCCKYTRSSTITTFKCVIDSKHAIRAPMIDRQSFSKTGLCWQRSQKTVSHQQLNLRGREEGWWDGGNQQKTGLAGGPCTVISVSKLNVTLIGGN